MMKKWKNVLLLFAVVCAAALPSQAADLVSYSASDSPGSAPDATEGVDVWTVTGDDGPNRSYRKDMQDGNANMWAIWDLDGNDGTYATHTFAGGALTVGQTVSLDWTHHINIDDSIGVRFLDGSTTQASVVFLGGKLVYSRYDTGTGVYTDTAKYYDRYDIFRVIFTLTGPNTYEMSITEGSIPDNPTGMGNNTEDGNPDAGNVVDKWTGTFTGTSITGIQVFTKGGNESDQWFDNLTVDDNWLSIAQEPYPASGQVDVPVSGLELSWAVPRDRSEADPEIFEVDPNLVSFDVYYSDDADPNFAALTPISVTSWDAQTLTASCVPPTLNKNSTYTWRVDSVLDDGTVAQGDEWTFDTELTRAIIVSNPTHQIVDAGTTVDFSVVIETESPATYQWYQYVDGVSDVQLLDGGDISGALTDTLTIANAEVADEGHYYCIIINDSGIPVSSAQAFLAIKRKVAYWPFEGNVADSVVAGSPASVLEGDPNFVPGIIGDGMEFEDSVDMMYTAPEEASYFDVCDYQITVACWVKTTDKQDWCPLVARNGEGEGWQLRQSGFTDDRPCFTTRGTGNDDGTPANRTIYDGQWHYVVATFDGTVKKVYIDGIVSRSYSSDDGSLIKEGDAATSPINPTPSPVAIAGRVSGGGEDELNVETWNIVAGIYDEVEIYNYALDAATIAQTYANVMGTDVCLSQVYDLNDDCTVDLGDISLLATEWLNSAIVNPAQ